MRCKMLGLYDNYNEQYTSFKNEINNLDAKIFSFKNKPKQTKEITFKQHIINETKDLLKMGIAVQLSLGNKDDEKVTEVLNRVLRINNIEEKTLNEVSTVKKVMKTIEQLDSYASVPL